MLRYMFVPWTVEGELRHCGASILQDPRIPKNAQMCRLRRTQKNEHANWLVGSKPSKNIIYSQIGSFPQIGVKIKDLSI